MVHANNMEHRDNLHGCKYCTAGIVSLEHELRDIPYFLDTGSKSIKFSFQGYSKVRYI